MKLDKKLWGPYKRSFKHTPLCIEPHCYKYSVLRFNEGNNKPYYCEYHAGVRGMQFISSVWDVLQQTLEEDEL